MNLNNVYQWLNLVPQSSNLSKKEKAFNAIRFTIEELTELEAAILVEDDLEIEDGIADVLFAFMNVPYHLNKEYSRVEQVYQYAVESNFTKFCLTEEDAEETVKKYSNGTHLDKMGQAIETYWVKQNNIYIILRKKDDKIMKSYKYKTFGEVMYENECELGEEPETNHLYL